MVLAVLYTPVRAASPPDQTRSPAAQLEAADQQFKARNYTAALEGYRAVLASGLDLGPRRPEIEYRYTQCLSRSGHADEPIREAERFAHRYPGTIWEARGQYWLARLLLGSPSWGYEVDGRVVRGNDLLWSQDARRARYVRLDQTDRPRILHALEAARTAFDHLRHPANTGAPAERQVPAGPHSPVVQVHQAPRLTTEEVNLNFDLALQLQDRPLEEWAARRQWARPMDPSWSIDPGSDYRPEWPAPKQVLFLLQQIQAQGEPHQTALARLAEARFADRYREVLQHAAGDRKKRSRHLPPTPYPALDAGHLLRSILADFPHDPIADRVEYAEGLRLARRHDLNAALAVFRDLVRVRPHSPWAADARAQIAGIPRRELSLDTGNSQPCGRPAHLTLGTRNAAHVDLCAYRVRLEDLLEAGARQRDPTPITSLAIAASDPALVSRLGPPIARWSVTPRYRGDHRPVRMTVRTPLRQPGAYLIVAGTADVTARGLLLISDRILIQKRDRDAALCWVVDAQTGAPDPQARVYVRESVSIGRGSFRDHIVEGQTDRDGLFVFTRARGAAGESLDLEVVARSGSQYAVSPALGSMWWLYNHRWEGLRAYSYTDRPIYRPGQVVHFRHLLALRGGGRLTPQANQAVQITVKDPHAEPIYHTTATTDAFGAVAGEFTLAEDAALGEYTISLTPAGSQEWIPSDAQFRVEEYRKPEFKVTVTPDQPSVRLGDPERMRVQARYYFGQPVVGARVFYRIYCSPWIPHYDFPDRWSFLYGYRKRNGTQESDSGGEFVQSGEARTDAAGQALISFSTHVSGSRGSSGSFRYTIEADVTDVSRRAVSGSGSVLATHQQFFAFLNTPKGFYVRGDRVPLEIITQDANARPVSAAGEVKVYRQTWNGGKRVETLVHQEPLATDAAGRGQSGWTADQGGAFRIAFETRDAWGTRITGSLLTWVAGLGRPQEQPLREGVRLVVADDVALDGGHARALLVVDRPGATVLVTQEAGDQILHSEVLHLGERMRIVDVPISRDHAPNFTLQAMMVRGGEVYASTRQVRVPLTGQLLNVRLTPDRNQYRPGEPATFRLLATDWQGQPVRGVFSVGIVDASLYALQGEYTPDIRQFFYAEDRPLEVQTHASPWTEWAIDLKDRQPPAAPRFQYWDRDQDVLQTGYWKDLHVADAWGFVQNGPAWEMLAPSRWGYGWGAGVGGFGGAVGGFGGGFGGIGTAIAGSGPGGSGRTPRAPRVVSDDAPSEQRRRANPSGAETPRLAPATIRSQFADTAFWTPAVTTDARGAATVRFTWPDNLTTWRAITRGWSAGAQVGNTTTEVVTSRNLLVRLQTPRFSVERDRIVLSADVQNYLPTPQRVRVRLEWEGDGLELIAGQDPSADAGDAGGTARDANPESSSPAPGGGSPPAHSAPERWIEVPKDGVARVDWEMAVRQAGPVKLRVTAQSAAESDSVEQSLPLVIHGVERLTAIHGELLDTDARRQSSDASAIKTSPAGPGVSRLRVPTKRVYGASVARLTFDVPGDRKPGSTELEIQLTPTIAGTVLDALPYLADYPYGCVEQTMSRFLPSVVVAKTLKDLGLQLEDLEKRADRLRDASPGAPSTGARAVTGSLYTVPKGLPGRLNAAEQAQQLPYTRLDRTPVFHTQKLREMVAAGLERLRSAQNRDGGWGWWAGQASDPSMSAYVLYGLLTLREAGWPAPDPWLAAAIEYVRRSSLAGDDLHRSAYAAAVLSMDPGSRAAVRPVAAGRLFAGRKALGPYTRALLAIALQRTGEAEKARTVLTELETTAKQEDKQGTIHWEANDSGGPWFANRVETNAAVLQAFLLIDPSHRYVPAIVRWLVDNRRSERWASTRETAMAVYALAQYVRLNRELSPDYTVTVNFDGRLQRQYHVDAANALLFDNRFIVPDALIHDGPQTITITKTGSGPLYYAAFLRSFSQEEGIQTIGDDLQVRRRYFRLVPQTADEAQQQRGPDLSPTPSEVTGDNYRRVPLAAGEEVRSGDLIEVELRLESKGDYDYLAFEDPKPAGCEPIELRSGEEGQGGLWTHVELRDQKVAFFLPELPQGTRTLTYRLRAETPGQFHVLPTNGYAMYAPEIRALSDEFQLRIRDRSETR